MKTNEKTAPILAEKDRNAVSLELMNRMKLHGMAAGFAEAATPETMGWNGWLYAWKFRPTSAKPLHHGTGSFGTGKITGFRPPHCVGIPGMQVRHSHFYANASKLLGALKVAKAKGTIETELRKIERCPLLILDDLFLVPLDVKERPLLLDIIEDRHGRKSIIITSQVPVSNWYDAIGIRP